MQPARKGGSLFQSGSPVGWVPFQRALTLNLNTKGTKIALRALLLIEINELRFSKLRNPDALIYTMQLVS